ncbi:hypothetical protein L4C39_00600, partial [Vibrio clamense]
MTQDDLDNGITYQYPVPADGESLTVTATITDPSGNTSPQASDSVTVGDTTSPDAPTVVITEDTNNDGTLTNSEIDGLVDVLVTPPANANVGDTLTVSGQPERVLTQGDLENGVSYQYPVPADGESLTVTATVTDPSDNTSPQASDSVTVGDTTPPDAPTVVITEDTNNDGTLANSEIDGLVDVLVTPPANANVGDTLTVSGQPDRVLTPGDLDNGVSYQYPVPADGESLTVTATVTDPSGNTSPQASDSVTVGDTTAPDAPTVVITEDTNNDGTLANSEIDGLVDVLVTPPANANVGDTLSVSGQPDRVLTQDDLDNGITYQYPVPADGESLTVTATVTDPSGNTSPQASDSAIKVGDGNVSINTKDGTAIEGEDTLAFTISRSAPTGEASGSESVVTFSLNSSSEIDAADIESVIINGEPLSGAQVTALFGGAGYDVTLADSESVDVVITPKDDSV